MTGLVLSTDDPTWIRVDDIAAVGGMRRAAIALAEAVGLGPTALADLEIISSEIASNLARHADDGTVLLRIVRHGEQAGIEIIAIDRGPGIPDVAEASVDGHSTAGTLGIGLGAIARKASEFHIYSRVGSGTVLAATIWSTQVSPQRWVAGLARPMPGQEVCGDAYAAREIDGRRQVMLCDGLGHGLPAAASARAALTEFLTAPAVGPQAVLDHIHSRIQHTRGVVAGIAELDTGQAVVRFAGIGNVAAVVIDAHRRQGMVSLPGIIGQQRRESREYGYALGPDALVVLHSDGLTDRWDLGGYPGLMSHPPVIIAATLLRDAARRRDDAAVLVARSP